jgi:uncharacterized protein YifN (PemK superfamily)
MKRFPVVPDGTFTPEITTGTADPVVIVASGKLKGLAVMVMPFTLVTLTVEGPPTGSARL